MGSRERKRAERRKRKRRSVERVDATAEQVETAPEPGRAASEVRPPVGAEEPESFQDRMAQRSEARNAEVRAGLEPLAEGERPAAVTVAAAVSAVLASVFTASAVVAALRTFEISGEEPSPVPLAIFAAALWLMTWGLWKARYWAVLGFQMLLVLFMLSSALGLVQVTTILQLVGSLTLLLGSGALFYFMIRAMARIQMPARPGDR